MITELEIAGVYRIEGHRATDERGVFRKVVDWPGDGGPVEARTVDEVAISSNDLAGTVRGLHYQVEPFAQAKTVWVAAGAIYDVVVDLREDSPSYGRWLAVELRADDDTALYLPAGVAHGFQTLLDATSVVYLMRGAYSPGAGRTLKWDDVVLGIPWPLAVTNISAADEAGQPWPHTAA